ncbi:MAG: hypothetical protein NTX50_22425 [Candidatus Sumerlaeota bacterium]|nr:hypothetical protein [Candidatus Sumerlaeota bacterium]
MRSIVSGFLMLAIALAFASCRSSSAPSHANASEPVKTYLSPKKDIIVELRPTAVSDPEVLGGQFEIWLVDARDKKIQRLLSTYAFSHELQFSPDEKFIIVTTYPTPEYSQNDLFARGKGLEYRFVGILDDAMWEFMYLKRYGKKAASRNDLELFSHRYIEPIRWVSDEVLLAKIRGYDSNEQSKESEAMMLLYNAATQSVQPQKNSR